ncbi:uncharacterized protein LOC126378361 isoform X1 [Pectinophora gossypiella]|uniref:uncharacterized protein LOC126378361 isoform X1 n=1 Tax=Pectinophora gossypiella TaxID=13191 RepID=UPI00214E843F|nr:uncharacterized protein LOC126378361 isoform X1 [Pectinophora gossypiella]
MAAEKKIKYKGTSNKPAPLGHDYEINIMMLSYLHAWNKMKQTDTGASYATNAPESYIATEVQEAGSCEDVVHIEIQHDKAYLYFLQAKHSCQKNKPIKLKDLLNEKNGDFSLLKYFTSIRDVKKKFDPLGKITQGRRIDASHRFIIITNMILDKEVTGLKEITEDFLFFEHEKQEGKLYRVGISDEPDSLFQRFKALLKSREEKVTCKTTSPSLNVTHFSPSPLSALPCLLLSLYKATIGKVMQQPTVTTFLTSLQIPPWSQQPLPLKPSMKSDNENELKEFFEEFIFAVNQPNVNQCRFKVEEELRKITGLDDTMWIARTLAGELSHWAHQKDGWFLTNRDRKNFFEYVNQHLASWGQATLTMNKVANILKKGIRFNQTEVIQALRGFLSCKTASTSSLCIVYYEHLGLTEIKVAQAIKESKKTIFSDLDNLRDETSDSSINPVNAFESKSMNCLIITVKTESELNRNIRLIKLFLDIVKKTNDKKIILIAPSDLRNSFAVLGMNYETIEDNENCLADLSRESQAKLAKERAVVFQDQKINLGLLMDNELKKKMSGEILENFFVKDYVVNQVHSFNNYEHVKNYYVDRELYQRDTYIGNEIIKAVNEFIITDEDYINDTDITDKDILLTTLNYYDDNYFRSLCVKFKHQNIHWLVKNNNGKLIWRRTHGSFTKIRKFVNNDEYQNVSPNTVKHIKVEDLQDRVVIITAEPGMGKSTALSHLAAKSKSALMSESEPLCIIKTNLEDHSTQFDNLVKGKVTTKDAIKFIYKAMNLEPRSSRSLIFWKRTTRANYFLK